MESNKFSIKRRLDSMYDSDSPLCKKSSRKLNFALTETSTTYVTCNKTVNRPAPPMIVDENSCGSWFSDHDSLSEASDMDSSASVWNEDLVQMCSKTTTQQQLHDSPFSVLYTKTTKVTKKSKFEAVMFNEPQIKKALDIDDISRAKGDDDEDKLIGDMSRKHLLPTTKNSKHRDLATITSQTLADILNGRYDDRIGQYMILDARYPYEYEGGHIKDAHNAYLKENIFNQLFESNQSTSKATILIVHCEFSSERGPKLMREIREKDRMINKHNYPHLNYPEMYLLEGGYKKFFQEYDQHCAPRSYLPMLHDNHRNELKFFRKKSKTWEMETRKTRINTKLKLDF